MRKIREVLRLRLDAGLSCRKIGLSCAMPRSTVDDCLLRFGASGLPWPLPEEMDDQTLEDRLYRERQGPPSDKDEPDWAWVNRELRKSKHVTLSLLWREYKHHHPNGYQFSWSCRQYAAYRDRLDPVMRQSYTFGEKCFVEYAGSTSSVTDPATGETRKAYLFLGVLGASNYTYAEATWTQDLASWLSSHVRMFQYFQGVPAILTPDNLKSGVTKANYYEPEINPSYLDLAKHYEVVVIPTRPRKPRDKAKVENGVLIAERWIMAALRNRVFFSLNELNEAISEKLEYLNSRPFQKMPGSRKTVFLEEEKPLLRPLPPEPYCFRKRKKARVNIDYHIEVEGHYYSVPYSLIHETVEALVSSSTVEVLYGGQRIASHVRSYHRSGHTTVPEHMPPRHRKMLEWTPERLLSWATKTGPATGELVEGILKTRRHPEQGYRSSLGVLRLSKQYAPERLEAACRRAVACRAYSYQSVKSILERGLDRVPLPSLPPKPRLLHENVRGAAYYETEKGSGA